MLKRQCFTIRIVGLDFSIICHNQNKRLFLGKEYLPFSHSFHKPPKITIQILFEEPPKINFRDKDLLLQINKMCNIYQVKNRKIFILPIFKNVDSYTAIGMRAKFILRKKFFDFQLKPLTKNYEIKVNSKLPPSQRLAIFNNGLTQGNIYISSQEDKNTNLTPLIYPFLEILFLPSLLPLVNGSLFHGSGVVYKNKCYLFMGPSGYGKSTLAKLWGNRVTLLHDDRIPIRKIGGKFLAYPLPNERINNQNIPLNGMPITAIFFIQPSRRNKIHQEKRLKKYSLLLPLCFNTVGNLYGLEKISNFCKDLMQRVPCYRLEFMPDERILDLITQI